MAQTRVRRRLRRVRSFLWVPRGPLGLALFVALIALLLMLAVVLSAVLLVGAVVAGLALAAVQGGRSLLRTRRPAVMLPPIDGRFFDRHATPLELYLRLVEQFDLLSARALAVEAASAATWRTGRRLSRLLGQAAELREQAIAVERAVTSERQAETARPGLWELIVAATELVRYLQALLEFPSGRSRAAQVRELAELHARRDELETRRSGLIRRLQGTDLRSTPRAARG